jgi:hypothetical protein
MKKLTLLLITLLYSTYVFTQILTTTTLYHNFTNDFTSDYHTFDVSFGTNKDVAWYYDHQFNDVFKRISTFEFGFTKGGEFYRAAGYIDGKGYEVIIQYFPNITAIRVTFLHDGRVLEFFK